MKSGFYLSHVTHSRFLPKKYQFDYNFFWTNFNLDELEDLDRKTRFFSYNKSNLVSFFDRDHIHLSFDKLKDNIQLFMVENGITEGIREIVLVTNPRILGYTFNPVSFYFIKTLVNDYVLIEIGNTFGEQKPYLLRPEHQTEKGWEFETEKLFYISPFISARNKLKFLIQKSEESLSIHIQDYQVDGTLELTASYKGRFIPWSEGNLIKLGLRYPLITFRIIFSIHYHALMLYLKKIPYFKKTDEAEFQTDQFIKEKGFFKKLL